MSDKRVAWEWVALLAPALLAAAVVIDMHNKGAADWTFAVRPIAVAVGAALAMTLAASIVLRSRLGGSATALLVAAALLSPITLALVLGGLGIWILAAMRARRRRKSVPPIWPAYLVVPPGAFFAVVAATAWGNGSFQAPAEVETAAREPAAPGNVAVLLLDGYPDEETLQTVFGYDNEPFLTALERRGFTVYRDSTSTAARTEISLLRMLSGESPPAYSSMDPNSLEAKRAVRRQLLSTRGASDIRELGYELVNVAPPTPHVVMTGWDRVVDSGGLNELEIALLGQSPLHGLAREWIMDDLRDGVTFSLRRTPIEMIGAGRFVLAHIMAPHVPFLWTADGIEAAPPTCWPGCPIFLAHMEARGLDLPTYSSQFVGNMVHLNRLVQETLDDIIAADPAAIVLIVSDHGARYSPSDTDEYFRNLLAVRAPAGGIEVGAAPTPDGIFRELAAAGVR
jgi:hypothetical protein